MSVRDRVAYVVRTGARRRLRDVLVGVGEAEREVTREDLARRFLAGRGIEIGAATWPQRVPPGTAVTFVDRVPRAVLVDQHAVMKGAELRSEAVVETQILDDAETLATLADASQDFVIANHVLEHLEDPVAALRSAVRVLRPGGVVFLSLPDRLASFDRHRPATTVEHVLADHGDGGVASRAGHYEEWARYVEGAPDVAARAAEFAAEDARHHFHVWTLAEFLELLRALDLPATLELGQRNHDEFNVVLRRH